MIKCMNTMPFTLCITKQIHFSGCIHSAIMQVVYVDPNEHIQPVSPEVLLDATSKEKA